MGCFSDKGDRDLVKLFFTHNEFTPQKCIQMAHEEGYAYVGFQNGGECWADDDYGKYDNKTPRNDDECNHKCRGDEDVTCGAGWRNSVFQVNDPNRIRSLSGNTEV